MDFPILINLMSPLSLLGAKGYFFLLFYFSMKIVLASRIAPDGTPRFAASHLGLFCLLMSHKQDARLIWVNNIGIIHGLSCINICRVSRKLFELQAVRPRVHTSSEKLEIVNAMKNTCMLIILVYLLNKFLF